MLRPLWVDNPRRGIRVLLQSQTKPEIGNCPSMLGYPPFRQQKAATRSPTLRPCLVACPGEIKTQCLMGRLQRPGPGNRCFDVAPGTAPCLGCNRITLALIRVKILNQPCRSATFPATLAFPDPLIDPPGPQPSFPIPFISPLVPCVAVSFSCFLLPIPSPGDRQLLCILP